MNQENKAWNERFRTLISLTFGILIGIALLFSTSIWETQPIVEESLMCLACFFAGIGAFGRIWCSLYIAGYKNNTLVTAGPYSLCRNPLYLFSFIGGAGVSLATETFTIPLVVILAFILYYPFVIKKEEKRLEGFFGDKYAQYRQTTPSFIPSLKSFKAMKEPETYSVNPRIFSHNIFDALWFIWLIGIFELLGGLKEAGILPILFQLY